MIYIIRHGQTDYNVLGKITGRIDISLNDNGIKEAYEVKDILKNVKFDYVFSSPLKRTIETAKIIANKKIISDERLIERFNGELEGKKKNELPKNFDFKSSDYNMEPVSLVAERVRSFFDEIIKKYPKKNILVVTHGGVIINIRYYFEGRPKSGSYEEYITGNCKILKYEN